jgi:hypothetical protein
VPLSASYLDTVRAGGSFPLWLQTGAQSEQIHRKHTGQRDDARGRVVRSGRYRDGVWFHSTFTSPPFFQ